LRNIAGISRNRRAKPCAWLRQPSDESHEVMPDREVTDAGDRDGYGPETARINRSLDRSRFAIAPAGDYIGAAQGIWRKRPLALEWSNHRRARSRHSANCVYDTARNRTAWPAH
jgi:hypothetical protein